MLFDQLRALHARAIKEADEIELEISRLEGLKTALGRKREALAALELLLLSEDEFEDDLPEPVIEAKPIVVEPARPAEALVAIENFQPKPKEAPAWALAVDNISAAGVAAVRNSTEPLTMDMTMRQIEKYAPHLLRGVKNDVARKRLYATFANYSRDGRLKRVILDNGYVAFKAR